MKTIVYFLLILFFVGFIIFKFTYISFEDTYTDLWFLNKFLVVGIFSLLVSFLLGAVLIKKLDLFWKVFGFISIFAVIFLLVFISLTNYDLQKLDYIFAKKVENFRTKDTFKNFIKDTGIIVGKDTLYIHQNASYMNVYEGRYEVYQSRFYDQYYVIKEDR